MERRYDGFVAPNGFYVLDTFTGEVRYIDNNSEEIKNQATVSQLASQVGHLTGNHSSSFDSSSFESEVISTYPYPLASPFYHLVRETDPRLKCRLVVDTFTAILKYLAIQLASEYVRATDVKDIQLHQLFTRDLSRPLISSWNTLIIRCLSVLNDNNVTLFAPELKVAYEKLETNCKDPFLISQTYSDENGEIKTKVKKLGKIQALIKYRNSLAHGFNQSPSRAQKEFEEYYPILISILQEIRFVARYTLWNIQVKNETNNGIYLMSANPTIRKIDFDLHEINPAISPIFLMNNATQEVLPLFTFFHIEQTSERGMPHIGKDVFVFEGNTKNSVIYLSTSGEFLENVVQYNYWKEIIFQKQIEASWVNEKTLTIAVLHSIGVFNSASGLQSLISSGKYLREAVVPRKELDEQLDSFCLGSKNGFVLGGESGIGKSTLLAHKTEEWQAVGHMVTFYRGSSLLQTDVANKFMRDCALKINYLEDFLSSADSIFINSQKRCFLVIDALNEFGGDLNSLIKFIDMIVAQAKNFPWFKVVVSIRDSAYDRLQVKFGHIAVQQYATVEEIVGGEKTFTNIIRLRPLSLEFVEKIYYAYREYKWKDLDESDSEGVYRFRPLTHFSEIERDSSTLELLRNPLMARLIIQAYHRAKLPSQLRNEDAMRLYFDNIILEKSSNYQGFPERKKFLSLLVCEMDRLNLERIGRDYLINLPAFRTFLIYNQKDSPYIQLLDLGVIMEEWESDNCYIRFSFDKFFEFLLAEQLWPKIEGASDIFEICQRISKFRILQGAIALVLYRFCKNEQTGILTQLIDIADEYNGTIREVVRDVCIHVLADASLDNIELFKEILGLMPLNPSHLDLEILILLVDKLYTAGRLSAFEHAIFIATKEAESLEDKKVLSDLQLFSAIFDIHQGLYKEARVKLELAEQVKLDLKDHYGLVKILIEYATIERYQRNDQASLMINTKALEVAESHEYRALQIEIFNNIANIWRTQGSNNEAENFYKKAYEIAKDIGDKLGMARVLHNRALITLAKFNQHIDSERLLCEALMIVKEMGDRRRMAFPLLNLGRLYTKQSRFQEARVHLEESLKIFRSLENRSQLPTIFNNIGELYRYSGDFYNSESYYLDALIIAEDLNKHNDIIESWKFLGTLMLHQNKISEARSFFIQAIKLAQEKVSQLELLALIHRSFPSLTLDEKTTYSQLDFTSKGDIFNQTSSLLLKSIMLSYTVSNQDKLDVDIIRVVFQEIMDLVKEVDPGDPFDLPIETMLLVANKLKVQSEIELANNYLNDVFQLIGDKKYMLNARISSLIDTIKN